MTIERLDYVATIRGRGNSGKEKATGEKTAAMKSLINDAKVYQINGIFLKFPSVLAAVLLELQYFASAMISRHKADVIITRSNMCFGTYLVSRIRGIPLIREWHADFLDEAQILFKGRKLKMAMAKVLQNWMMFFLSRSHGVIFNNPRLEAYYKKNYPGMNYSSTVVENGTDPVMFRPMDQDAARRELGLDQDAKYLLFLGSMSPWHGVDYILDVFESIGAHDSTTAYRLLLVGGGGAAEGRLKELCRDNQSIIVVGQVRPDQARTYIAAADLCLLPVRDQRVSPGSPLKLFDYAACGRPIAAQSDVPGYADIVEKHGLGFGVDFTQPKEAAESIMNFIRNENLSHYEKHNRKMAEQHLTWTSVVQRWLAFSETVISDYRANRGG